MWTYVLSQYSYDWDNDIAARFIYFLTCVLVVIALVFRSPLEKQSSSTLADLIECIKFNQRPCPSTQYNQLLQANPPQKHNRLRYTLFFCKRHKCLDGAEEFEKCRELFLIITNKCHEKISGFLDRFHTHWVISPIPVIYVC